MVTFKKVGVDDDNKTDIGENLNISKLKNVIYSNATEMNDDTAVFCMEMSQYKKFFSDICMVDVGVEGRDELDCNPLGVLADEHLAGVKEHDVVEKNGKKAYCIRMDISDVMDDLDNTQANIREK